MDDDNANGLRPESVTVQLLRNGVVIDTMTVSAETNWSYSFENLARVDERGNEYVYTVSEKMVAGYYGVVLPDGTLVNTLIPGVVTPDDETDPRPGTPEMPFSKLNDAQLTDLLQVIEYEVPLYGELLGTGAETPLYPFVFAGLGMLALLVLAIEERRKSKQ